MRILAIEANAQQGYYSVILQEGNQTQQYDFSIEPVDLSGQTVLVGQWDDHFEKDFLYQARLHGLIGRLVLRHCTGEGSAFPIEVDGLSTGGADPLAASA